MSITDIRIVPVTPESADTEALLREAALLERDQKGRFTTSLSNAERRYLDIMAVLFARNAMPGGYGCTRRGCGGASGCTGCAIADPAVQPATSP